MKLCVEDYSQIKMTIQNFEDIFENSEQIMDAKEEKH